MEDVSYNNLKSKRTTFKAKITRVTNWVDENIQSESNPKVLKRYLESLETAFRNYEDVQDSIEILPNFSDFDDENRVEVESKFHNFVGKIEFQIEKLSGALNNVSSNSISPPQGQVNVNLPQINIKPFKGDAPEWTSFIQLFETLIMKNQSLSDIQKFIYLRMSLRDEPLKLIEGLSVTHKNFEIALDILRKRYENKLTVINAHFVSLLETTPMSKCNASNLREFVTNCKRNWDSLHNLGYTDTELLEFFLIYVLSKKIDLNTKRAFETERNMEQLPSLNQFFKFLEKRSLVFENLSSSEIPSNNKNPRPQIRSSLHVSNRQSCSSTCCPYCGNSDHKIYTCTKFKGMSLPEKKQFINSKQLCFNCLTKGHQVSQCSSKRNCIVCSKRHHSLLHPNQGSNSSVGTTISYHGSSQFQSNNHPASVVPASSRSVSQPSGQSQVLQQGSDIISQTPQSFSGVSTRKNHVLLATAVVCLYDSKGLRVKAKAILDNGSQNSFVTEGLIERLGYVPYKHSIVISGIGLCNNESTKMIDLTFSSCIDPKQKFRATCAILPAITCQLPQFKLNVSQWNIPSDLPLADPTFNQPSDIDILIGADIYYKVLSQGIVPLGRNLPSLVNTHLGWVVGGSLPTHQKGKMHHSFLTVSSPVQNVHCGTSLLTQTSVLNELEQQVSRFWTLEEVSKVIPICPADEAAESSFLQTTKILKDGRFQVDLPLKSPNENHKLGDSFAIARKRFNNLEKRFAREPRYYEEYKIFIDEYLSLGHGQIIPNSLLNDSSQHKYFLPHHAVFKEDSASTKVRVVFDGSCKSSSGVSLNDILLTGYQVQPDLFDILCRFRSYKFVLTSDIVKMFRQIQVNPAQRFLLNILWRDNPQEELKCIEFSTVTYGTSCASFLATRVLKEIAIQNSSKFPIAAEILNNQTYVDDILGGADNILELDQLYSQLNTLLSSHGFKLHKWCSNSKHFLNKISEMATTEREFDMENVSSKVLGLRWKPDNDLFGVSIPGNVLVAPMTKRKVLSILSQCYDPLGFLAPLIVRGKLIIQRLWSGKTDWDTPVNDQILLQDWNQFTNDFALLKALDIPRYLFLNKIVKRIEFHGFADASLKAYAACVYIRTIYVDNTVSCFLISSKSRVAPLKTVTLPRLELCAMLLLSQLVVKLLNVFKTRFQVNSVVLWSDSEIALHWIKGHSSRWSIFVANRVGQIQELTEKFTWRHVRSENNPADLPSRGIVMSELLHMQLWWNGPEFLLDPTWNPSGTPEPEVLEIEVPEERKIVLITSDASDQSSFWNSTFNRFSSFSRLQRVIAYCLRFRHNIRSDEKRYGSLQVEELNSALKLIVKVLQHNNFFKEIQELNYQKPLSSKQLAKLNIFLDEDDILRVGGRLENAEIPFDQKHPMLLPSRNHVVSLMLSQKHNSLGHAGAQNVLSNFRLRFWPLDGLREVKRIIRNCIVCYRFRAQPTHQMMADLPRDRVLESRCFSRVGVDYGGPLLIKSSNLRRAPLIKAYIAVFVCMSTKAVHLELVTGLSAEEFIMTLKRFIARRGNPSTIYSDNGTNFVGARNQLYDLFKTFKNGRFQESIKEFASQNEIEFKFIPPRSPHWGGVWEAAVKSTKHHLRRLIGEAHFTFEELYTVLVQIESILNSRPLCPLSNDPNDIQTLTPGHFLIGSSLTAPPEKDVTQIKENRLSRWQRMSRVTQSFWNRWRIDYLNRLQNRPKWFHPVPELKVGSLVLLKDEESPPLKWPLARVIEVFPGKDGRIRVVKVRTADGILTRSIAKMCPLPITKTPESSP